MAAVNRLEMIRKIIAQTPQDPFPRYGLALELKSQGRAKEALLAFADLAATFPGYVPQYLMHATVLIETGGTDRAKEVLAQGIAVGKKANNSHAVGEMQELLQSL